MTIAGAFVLISMLVSPLSPSQASDPIPESDIEACKVPNGAEQSAGFSFPRRPDVLPTSGVIKAAIIFVDFPDAVGTDEKQLGKVARTYTDNFKKFFRAQSFGKVDFQFDYVPKYFRIKSKTTSYGMNLRKGGDGNGVVRYFQDAINAADSEYDFSQYQAVYVIPSNTNREITYGPAIGAGAATSNEGPIFAGAVAGTDSRRRENSHEWAWMAHETGHLFGLGHPWQITSDAQGRTSNVSEAAVWDLMINIGDGTKGDFLAWSRFLLDWLDPNQIGCYDIRGLKTGNLKVSLTAAALNTPGNKLLVFRTAEYKAIAVEVRVNSGLNKFPKSWEGPIVYEVNNLKSGYDGAIKLLSRDSRRDWNLLIGNMRLNQKVKQSGLEIQYRGKFRDNYVLSISLNR